VKVIGNLTKDAIIRAVASEGLTVTQVVGTPTVFEAATTTWSDIAYDTNAQKVVISYADGGNSNAGTAIVGTVSGNTISFGSPVVWEATSGVRGRITYDTNAQKVVIAYTDDGNSGYATAIVGTVSGTSISFGSPVVFRSSDTIIYDITYDSNAQKVVVATRYQQSPYAGYGIVGTVSGTSISFGSPTVFNNASTGRVRAVYDTNAQKVVFAFEDNGNSSHGTAIVGTVSGTGISFGSEVVFNAATSSEVGMVYDSDSQKIVIGYRDQGDSNIGKAIVGTVSGTSISFGSAAAFGAGNDEYITVVYDSDAQKIVVAYSDTTTDGKLNVGTVSGTSISFGSEVQFESGRANYVNAVFDPIQKRVVIAYQDVGNSSHGTAVVTKTGYSATSGGTIADGKPVIVNANGTVSTVSGSLTSAGSPTTFVSAEAKFEAIAFDSSNNKVVVAYRNDAASNSGYAVVGTVSGTSISFGSPVLFNSGTTNEIGITFDSNSNKVVIAYQDGGNSNSGTAIVGTVSGTSISFGSEATFNGSTNDTDITFDSNSNKVVVAYQDNTNSGYGTAKVGTVSGTSISFGSATVFQSSNMEHPSVAFDSSNNKVVIACGTGTGEAYVGTVSGTSISFGSAVVFESGSGVQDNAVVFDSNSNKIVIAYRDGAATGAPGAAIVGTVSGTSISFGTKVNFNQGYEADFISGTFDSSTNKVIIAYRDRNTDEYGTAAVGTVSGTSISFDTPIVYEQANSVYNAATFDSSANKVVIAYLDGGNSSYGTGVVFSIGSTNVTSENFVGIMKGATLDGTNSEILSSCSIARNQTGLTSGQTYFVTPTGALSETAGNPSVTAGTAISSTELIVKG